MKRNLIFVSCLALLLSACSLLPSQSPEVTTVEALTGVMTLIPTHNQDGIPYCKDYLLKPLQTGDIIKIDDVVEKCKVQKAHLYYSFIGGIGASVPYQVFPLGNGIWGEGYGLDKENIPYICAERDSLGGWYPVENWTFLDFLTQNNIYDEGILNNYAPYYNTEQRHPDAFHCRGSGCKGLTGLDRGNKNGHLFYHGRRGEISEYGENIDYGSLLIIDKKVYHLGESQYSKGMGETIIIRSKRILADIQDTYALVRRVNNGKYLEKFKNNPYRIKKMQNGTLKNNSIIATIDIETCKIPLEKTP